MVRALLGLSDLTGGLGGKYAQIEKVFHRARHPFSSAAGPFGRRTRRRGDRSRADENQLIQL